MLFRISVLFLIFSGLLACSQAPSSESNYFVNKFSGQIMGTTYNVSIVSQVELPDSQYSMLKESIHQVLSSVDMLMSTYKQESEISKFNRLSPGNSMELADETLEVLALASSINQLTNGYFDVTVGPLVDLWGFGAGSKSDDLIPSNQEITKSLSIVGMNNFSIHGNRIKKDKPVEINLSAVAKGYAADVLARDIELRGYKNYLVEVGGEVVTKGHNGRGVSWVLGIEAPTKHSRKVYNAVSISGMAMATSGDYRNYFERDGYIYSHTLDPKTGMPVDSKLASVTVVAENCAKADALATGLLAMGFERAIEFSEKHDISAFFIYRNDNELSSLASVSMKQYLM